MKSTSECRQAKDTSRKTNKTFKRKLNNKIRGCKEFEEWKKIPPKQGEPKEKAWNTKTHFYCHEHQLRGRHRESEYEKKKRWLSKNENIKQNTPSDRVANSAIYDQENYLTSITDIVMNK